MPHNPSEDPKSVGLEVFRLARQSAHLLQAATEERKRSLRGRFSSLWQPQTEVGGDPNFRLNRLGTVIMDRYQQLQAIKPVSEGETTEEATQRYETVMNLLVHPDAQAMLGNAPQKLDKAFEQIHGLAFGLTGSLASEAWIAKTFERIQTVHQDIDYFTFYNPPLETDPPFINFSLLHHAVEGLVIAPFHAENEPQGLYRSPEEYMDYDLTQFRDEHLLIPNLANVQDAKQRLRQIIGAEPLSPEQQMTYTGDSLAIAKRKVLAFFTMSFPPEVNMQNRRILLEGLSEIHHENPEEWQAARATLIEVAERYFGDALKVKHLLGEPDAVGELARRRAKQTDFSQHFQETLEASVKFKLGLFTAMLDSTARQTA